MDNNPGKPSGREVPGLGSLKNSRPKDTSVGKSRMDTHGGLSPTFESKHIGLLPDNDKGMSLGAKRIDFINDGNDSRVKRMPGASKPVRMQTQDSRGNKGRFDQESDREWNLQAVPPPPTEANNSPAESVDEADIVPNISDSPAFTDMEIEFLKRFLMRPEIVDTIVNPHTLKFLGKRRKSLTEEPFNEIHNSGALFSSKLANLPQSSSKEGNQLEVGTRAGSRRHSRPQKRSTKNKMLGTIMLPNGNAEGRNLSIGGIQVHLWNYLPIALYLSVKHGFEEEQMVLASTLTAHYKDMKNFEPRSMLDNETFLLRLFTSVLKYEEAKIFMGLLNDIKSLNVLLTDRFMKLFDVDHRYEYLLDFFVEYEKALRVKNKTATTLRQAQTRHLPLHMASQNSMQPHADTTDKETLTHHKQVILVKNYMTCTQDNKLLLEILHLLGVGAAEMVSLFLESKEEDRFIWIAAEPKGYELLRYIDADYLVEHGLYKTLILLDRSMLIDVFNKQLPDKPRDTVYDELCHQISEGKDVEALCNVVIHVHNTFWDMEKLPKFHKALNSVFKVRQSIATGNENKQPRSDSKDNWLVFIQNPLLFCIKLVYFFEMMREQLDFKNKEINELRQDLVEFCISYCENAGDDVRLLNLFDKDSKNKEFLEYAFNIGEMSILEIEAIEGLIYNMWDLGRHTMQTITQFMRVNFMKEDITKFSTSVFTRKYEMPIEENDSFQMEFRFTSNSVFLRVVSEMLWPVLLIVVEFIFSMRIIRMYKNFQFTDNWLSQYYNENQWFTIFHALLRGQYIIANIIKTILLKRFRREGFYHQQFFNILNVLYILQMIVYPLFFWDQFWIVNNLEMLIVLTMCGYVFYNGLAIQHIGVNLRIFARMVYVVLIFGTVSCLLITLIAYPIHIIYIDFSQVVDGQLFPQMNVFRSLYNGVLTLFEFVFGAVIFVRPYLEENLYTYSITFIMVIFSFFGNIMLANMLVAFLSRQFEGITQKAKYYTRRMQFGLVKIFQMRELDTMFTMPYPFVFLALPFYLFMLPDKPIRRKVNLLLRKFIHLLNVFVPTFVIMNIYLCILMPIRYIEMFMFVLIRAPLKFAYVGYTFMWMLGGPFLLLKLYIQDVGTMCRIMLDFTQSGENLLTIELSEDALSRVVSVFSKINKIALQHLPEKTVSVYHFLEYMGLSEKPTLSDGKSTSPVSRSEVNQEEDKQDENNDGLGSDINQIYTQNDPVLAKILLKKFAMSHGKGEELDALELDLEFMVSKFKNNINLENVHKLVGFDKKTLSKASKNIADGASDKDARVELVNLKQRIGDMDKVIATILKDVDAMRSVLLTKVSSK